MSIDKYNAEGYYDPVTYEALSKIEKEERAARKAAAFRPMIYIFAVLIPGISKKIQQMQECTQDLPLQKIQYHLHHICYCHSTFHRSMSVDLLCL